MEYGQSVYGQDAYGTIQSTSDNPEESIVDLMKYLPDYWQENITMKELQEILGIEVANLIDNLMFSMNQMFINTATTGLARWEKILGLETDIKKPYAYRQERIKAKMMGSGTTTKQMIVNVASAFSNGEVEVVEHSEEYRFIVKFIGVKGVPGNMKDLTATIEEIKPAHLAFEYQYTYNTWGFVKSKTWGAGRAYTWGSIKTV